MKIEQLALWALLGISFAGVCSAQTYSGFEALKDLGGLEGTSILYVRKENGSVLTAPRLPSQVGFSDVQLSPDRRRVGWVALMPSTSTSYPIPMRVVIFKGDKGPAPFSSVDSNKPQDLWNYMAGVRRHSQAVIRRAPVRLSAPGPEAAAQAARR